MTQNTVFIKENLKKYSQKHYDVILKYKYAKGVSIEIILNVNSNKQQY